MRRYDDYEYESRSKKASSFKLESLKNDYYELLEENTNLKCRIEQLEDLIQTLINQQSK